MFNRKKSVTGISKGRKAGLMGSGRHKRRVCFGKALTQKSSLRDDEISVVPALGESLQRREAKQGQKCLKEDLK